MEGRVTQRTRLSERSSEFREDGRQTAPYSPEFEPDIVLNEPQPRHRTPSAWMIFLTIILSKKVENHAAAVALHFFHYNFARIHKTLRITPAMAAGISDHVWSYEEIAALAA